MCKGIAKIVRARMCDWCPLHLRAQFFAVAALSVQLSFGVPMTTQADDAYSMPPVAPEDEKSASNKSFFIEACRSQPQWNDLVIANGWKLGNDLLTQRDEWGVIYRVDFTIPGADTSPAINRIICWQTPSGQMKITVAISQNFPPLG